MGTINAPPVAAARSANGTTVSASWAADRAGSLRSPMSAFTAPEIRPRPTSAVT